MKDLKRDKYTRNVYQNSTNYQNENNAETESLSEKVDELMRKTYAKERRDIRRDRLSCDCYGYIDGHSELHIRDVYYQDYTADAVEEIELSEQIKLAVDSLPQMHRRRIILYFWKGLNCAEIGRQEGVSEQAAHESIKVAIKKLKKFLKKGWDLPF